MAMDGIEAFDWERITFARARVLAGLENQQTEQKIADGLIVEFSTVRSHVEALKGITGCHGVRDSGGGGGRTARAGAR